MLPTKCRCLVILTIVASIVSIVTSAGASTISDVADTYITIHPNLGGPASVHGQDPVLQEIGPVSFYAYPLIRFDLSGFSGDTVLGPATLTLHVAGTWNSRTVSQTIEAFSLLVPWNESTLSWNSFGPGPICGTNVSCTSLDTISVTVNPGDTVTFPNLPASLVQGWINNPASNYGLLLFSTTSVDNLDIAFASRESTVAPGPELTFQTTRATPEPSTLVLLASTAIVGFRVLGRHMRHRPRA